MMTNAKASLLVIDDEEGIRQHLLDFLEDYDEFDVRAVPTAEAALETLEAAPVNLCIVDMRLPGMNGLDFALLALRRGLCSRFVMHTGSIDFALPEELAACGHTEADVFLKPCDMASLVERIRDVLGEV